MKRIGMLTGGGDCPGLNAVIRGVVQTAKAENWHVIGFKQGWKGIIQNVFVELDEKAVAEILPRGGTILGTSRTNPYKKEGDAEKANIYENKNVLPRAFFAEKAVIIKDGKKILEKMKGKEFEPEKEVVLEEDFVVKSRKGAEKLLSLFRKKSEESQIISIDNVLRKCMLDSANDKSLLTWYCWNGRKHQYEESC